MKISTKGRHAVTAMMELALRNQSGPVTLGDISVEQSISVSYLEQLFARLRGAGLVTGMRGPGGGYRLQRAAADISVAEILQAIDDVAQSEQKPALGATKKRSDSLALWDTLSQRIYDYLDSISLADAVEMSHRAEPESGRDLSSGIHRHAAA
jgi:Rrf2 family iron-sulfur cluster assembly transcriptional regulator